MSAEELKRSFVSREARIAVIGAGYVGLPLGVAFAAAGFRVVLIDVDSHRVDALRRGVSYISDVPDELIRAQIESGRFEASLSYDVLRDVHAIFVAVPTPYDRAKQPDLSAIIACAEGITTRLRSGQLIILESTTYPGTTDEVMRPILERSNLRAGEDFWLAFSPERVDPGNTTFRIENTPKVVGGINRASTELAVALLEQVIKGVEILAVSSARVAEMTKLLENTFRAVNIAFVNELAVLCDRMGIDIWEVIAAAKTKPYGFMAFYPGPGVGGHCIPVDPYYLAAKAREYDFHTKFIELAAETNLAMPFFTVDRIRRQLNRAGKALQGARILVIGAAFKKDVDDARHSAAIRVMEILLSEGARVEFHDPHVNRVEISRSVFGHEDGYVTLASVPLGPQVLSAYDLVAILVAHSRVDFGDVVLNATRIFDAVDATRDQRGRAEIERL